MSSLISHSRLGGVGPRTVCGGELVAPNHPGYHPPPPVGRRHQQEPKMKMKQTAGESQSPPRFLSLTRTRATRVQSWRVRWRVNAADPPVDHGPAQLRRCADPDILAAARRRRRRRLRARCTTAPSHHHDTITPNHNEWECRGISVTGDRGFINIRTGPLTSAAQGRPGGG
jgi:hypothetical protein